MKQNVKLNENMKERSSNVLPSVPSGVFGRIGVIVMHVISNSFSLVVIVHGIGRMEE